MTGSGTFRQLTIFHYHLLPGGVTDVIVLSVRAILQRMDHLKRVFVVYGRRDNADRVREKILSGLEKKEADRLKMVHLREIDYLEKVENPPTPQSLLKLLERRFPGEDNLWMVHNYHLGKNPPFTQALLLAAENPARPLLFQIHDFPECSRYANLKALKEGTDRPVYPRKENTAYCVINTRDRNNLIKAGMGEGRVEVLNNPVPLGPTVRADPEEIKDALFEKYAPSFPGMTRKGKLLFYPVRSIRRKNIFEAAFLVKLWEGDGNFLVSLPGISPAEKPYSDLAERAFREGLIPGLWGVGADEETELLNYPNFWAASDMVVSPSIQEGFGYLYLNALHWRKPLFARYLDIMEGFISLFEEDYSHFYRTVYIPLGGKEKSELLGLYEAKIENLKYVMPPGRREILLSELKGMTGENRVCFSYLSPERQYDCLVRLDRDRGFREEALLLNRENLRALDRLNGANVPDRDRDMGITFGADNYAATLESIMACLQRGCGEEKDVRNIQGELEKEFFTLPYLRLLYGEGK